MVGRTLVAVAAFILASCHHHSCSCGFERTELAQEASEEAPTCQSLPGSCSKNCTLWIREENEKESPTNSVGFVNPPLLELPRRETLCPEESTDDVALQALRHPKFGAQRHLRSMRKTLVQGMGRSQEEIPQQINCQERPAASCQEDKGSSDKGFSDWRRFEGLDDLPGEGSLDRHNPAIQNAQHRPSRQFRPVIAGAATTRIASAASQGCEDGNLSFDRGRGENFDQLEGTGQLRHGAIKGVCREDAQFGSKSQRTGKSEIAVTCAFEQAEPFERQSCFSRKEATAFGQGMGRLHEAHDRQDFLPCTDVRTEQGRVDGIFQPKTRGAQILQSRNEPSFQELAGWRGCNPRAAGRARNLPILHCIEPADPGATEQDDHDLRRRHGGDSRSRGDGRSARWKDGISAETQIHGIQEHCRLTTESRSFTPETSQRPQGSHKETRETKET